MRKEAMVIAYRGFYCNIGFLMQLVGYHQANRTT